MRTVQSAPAAIALRPFVRAFAARTVAGVLGPQPMPAFLETVIHFDFADPLTVIDGREGPRQVRPLEIVGPHTSAGTSLGFDGNINTFAIFLQPTALWSLFHVPPSAIAERHYEADDILGQSVRDLWHVLAERTGFVERVRAAEAFLLKETRTDSAELPSTAAASSIVRTGGQTVIQDLAGQLHIGVRQLERLFLRDLGISPKRFARVARFQTALDTRVRHPETSWLNIAVNAGYHDQMHLVHDFRALAGYAPQHTFQRLGDSRPAALALSHGGERNAVLNPSNLQSSR
ncbi:hypothetical protein DF223_06910 [Mycetocola zhujimingii]|uniref:HTH araC/xylS-type domain-containing protein n=2 Tax=Mycetocola zhujimingii TaxID=2079792 RepID=A0A2U1TEM0_9MICO|nr:hypothetical protein DF223_06910 [Mycetocola zhujimingii]